VLLAGDKSIAGRIGGIPAFGLIVVRCSHCSCTNGSGTNTHRHARAHISSVINAARMDASDVSSAYASSASR
jgi:hypothetical protein